MRNYTQHKEPFCAVGILLVEYLWAAYYGSAFLVSLSLFDGLLLGSEELLNWTHFGWESEQRSLSALAADLSWS